MRQQCKLKHFICDMAHKSALQINTSGTSPVGDTDHWAFESNRYGYILVLPLSITKAMTLASH